MNTESSSLSKIERHKNFIIDFLYWAIIVACIFIGGKYLLPVLLPSDKLIVRAEIADFV